MKHSKFKEACINGSLEEVQNAANSWTKKPKDLIDEVDEKTGETAFHLAVKSSKESLEKVDYFIEKNGDINKRDNKKFTPIMLAIITGKYDVFKRLLTEIENKFQERTLELEEALLGTFQFAIFSGNIEVLKELVSKHKHLINKPWRYRTPLYFAIDRLNNQKIRDDNDTNLNVISLLHANGIELENGNHFKESSLHALAKVDTSHSDNLYNLTKDTIKKLFENQKKELISAAMLLKNETGATPLILAVQMKHTKQVEWFLRYGKDKLELACINAHDKLSETIIHKAACAEVDILPALLNVRGIKPYTRNKDNDTPLHLGIRDRRQKNISLLLYRCKKDQVSLTEHANKAGNTPLHEISLASDLESLTLISDPSFNMDLNAKNNEGETALMISATQNNEQSVKCAAQLIKMGADVNCQDKKLRAPLHRATNNVNMIDLLLECKDINIDLQDDKKETALMKAVKNNHTSSVTSLLKKSPDHTIKNREGKTAENIADDKGFKIISKMLQEYRMNQFSTKRRSLKKSKKAKPSTGQSSYPSPSAPPIQLPPISLFGQNRAQKKDKKASIQSPPAYDSPKK